MSHRVFDIEHHRGHLKESIVELALQAAGLVSVDFGHGFRVVDGNMVWCDANKVAISLMLLHNCGGSASIPALFYKPQRSELCHQGAGISPE
jgi:hypothetical protein